VDIEARMAAEHPLRQIRDLVNEALAQRACSCRRGEARHRDRRTRGGADHGRSPRIAINGTLSKHGAVRKTAVDRRTTRHAGYRVSQILRKRIEEVFGWIKAQAGVDQIKVRGLAKAEAVFIYAVAAYNLIRIPKLLAAPA